MSSSRMFALVATVALLAALVPMAASQGIGPAIVLNRASLGVTEGGGAASYSVSLASPSPATVVVAIAGGTGDLAASPASLTFPAGSTAAQTVVVTATDDGATEGTESFALLHTATSDDPAYNGRTATLTATVTDNDLGVVLLHGGADASGTSVSEAGGHDTVRVALGAAPTSTVTVRLTPDPQLSVSTLTLTFTASNWKTVRDVTLAAANDQVAQGTRTKTVTAATASSHAAYDGLSASLQATVLDNDAVGYQFTAPGQASLAPNALPTLAFAEGGESSFTLKLTSQPTGPVTVSLGATAGATTVPSSLAFTASSWSTPQTVRVLRGQDSIDEGDSFVVTATLATTTPDTNYASIPSPVTATVTDDDLAAILLDHTGGDTSVREGGTADAFTVALATQPRAPVTVGLAAPAGLAVDPPSLVFDAASWATARMVSVRAVDDASAELPQAGQVAATASGGDAIYNGKAATLPVRILDDDGVLLVEESGGSTAPAEGGAADTFTVRLIGDPDSPVTVTLTASDGTQFQVNGAATSSLVFDPGTGTAVAAPCSAKPTTVCPWDVPQTVQVTAVADHRIDGPKAGTIALRADSADPAFDDQVSRPVAVTAVDTDVARLVFNGAADGTVPSLAVTEGGATSYGVKLSSIPTGTVTVALTGTNGAVASPASLSFDASNWASTRTVTVTVPRDQVDQGSSYGATVAHAVSASADAHFSGLTAAVPVAVTDHPDDIAGWMFSTGGQTGLARNALPSLALAEGGSVPYTVRLASKPTGSVVLSVAGSGGAVATPASLTFTPTSWATPQSVTVAVAQDAIDQGASYAGNVAQSAATADAMYATVPGPIAVTVTDDDVAALRWVATGPSTVVQEGGASDVIHAVLATQPVGPVSLALSAPGDLALSTASLSFTASDWNVPQPVTVSAVDDATPELTEARAVSALATSGDALYHGQSRSITATVLDNDGVLVVQPTGGDTAVQEGGATDAYTVRLVANPTSRVTVTISAGDQARVNGGATAVLVFEPGSGSAVPARCPQDPTATCQWDHPQTVTVSAVDDALVEGSTSSIVTHTVSSGDKRFDGVPSASLHAVVLDNDRGVLLTPSDGSTRVVEGGISDTYTVALSMAPTFSVAVLVEAPSGLAPSPDTLFFDAESWAIPQTITLVAVNDQVDQGTRVLQVAHRTSSADDTFHALSVPLLAVTVVDNDGGQGGSATGTIQ